MTRWHELEVSGMLESYWGVFVVLTATLFVLFSFKEKGLIIPALAAITLASFVVMARDYLDLGYLHPGLALAQPIGYVIGFLVAILLYPLVAFLRRRPWKNESGK